MGLIKMIDHYYAVIMAGGGGTRLWPYSRKTRPKQLLDLSGDGHTLFQIAVERLANIFPPENILIVTTADLAEKLRMQSPEIPEQNYLLEPLPRGTASPTGSAAGRRRRRPCSGSAAFRSRSRPRPS